MHSGDNKKPDGDYRERELVTSLSKGDLAAFNSLFRKYSSRLYYFALGYLKSEAESEELVQEVFMKIWEKRSQLREEYSFRSFLFTISYNIIKKHFRTRENCTEYFKTTIYEDLDIATAQSIDYQSLCDFVTELASRMPVRRREIFLKSRMEGMSIKEISEELNINHKTVENHLSAALKFIRENLRNDYLVSLLFFYLFLAR